MPFFTDEIRSPVQVDDLAAAILALDASGVVHLGGADAVSRYEFARLVVTARGTMPSRQAVLTRLATSAFTRR